MIISSRLGFYGYGLLLSLSGFCLLAFIAVLDHVTGIFAQFQFIHSMRSSFTFVIVVLLASPAILWLFSYKVSVSKDYVVSKSFFHQSKLNIESINEIAVPSGYGWLPLAGFNLILYCESGEGTAVINTLFWNSHKVTKAIVEAARTSSPDVYIHQVLIDSYILPS